MQPQEQIDVQSATSGWLGAELLSLMPALFFLTLGYLVTRTWTVSLRAKALSKKLDDEDTVDEDTRASERREELIASPQLKTAKSRNSNAQERRRQRKTKEVSPKSENSPQSDNNASEFEPVTPAVVAPAPVQVILEERPQTVKKVEQPQEQLREGCEGQPQAPADEQASPEMPVDEQASQEAAVNERVAKLLAKKMERKAKKALEKKAQEKALEEEQVRQLELPAPREECAGGDAEEISDIATFVEMKSEVEALSNDAQTDSTPSMDPESVQSSENENQILDNNKQDITEDPESVQSIEHETLILDNDKQDIAEDDDARKLTSAGSSDTNLDSMETDYVKSEDESLQVNSTPDGICETPEMSPRDMTDMTSPPLVWCGANQPDYMPEIQIEGWIPVAVPAHLAPPGAFDGLWRNSCQERIVIDHSEVIFESGEKWVIQQHSLTNLSVYVGDEEFKADLDPETHCLKWSDGDVWICEGQTENQQHWAAAASAPQDPDAPHILWEGAQLTGEQFFPMEDMPFVDAAMLPKNMAIPEDAQDWEICWDWSKKGWCPRGAACDWYHPAPSPCSPCANFCPPCGEDGPFADEAAALNPGLPMF